MAEEPIAFVRASHTPAARTGYPGGQKQIAASGGGGFTAAQVRFDRAELIAF